MLPNETGCPACAKGRLCSGCGRIRIITAVAATPGIPVEVLTDAVDAVAGHPAVVRSLAAALDADPDALTVGAHRRWVASSTSCGRAGWTCRSRPAAGAAAPASH
jgi:hypothetical protein